jgi:hypothetical protein
MKVFGNRDEVYPHMTPAHMDVFRFLPKYSYLSIASVFTS